jgi:hypothetical protein
MESNLNMEIEKFNGKVLSYGSSIWKICWTPSVQVCIG